MTTSTLEVAGSNPAWERQLSVAQSGRAQENVMHLLVAASLFYRKMRTHKSSPREELKQPSFHAPWLNAQCDDDEEILIAGNLAGLLHLKETIDTAIKHRSAIIDIGDSDIECIQLFDSPKQFREADDEQHQETLSDTLIPIGCLAAIIAFIGLALFGAVQLISILT